MTVPSVGFTNGVLRYKISQVGAHRIGMSLSSGTFSVLSSNGRDLSANDAGFVTVKSKTAGLLKEYFITANQSFDDATAGGGSDIIGALFGFPTGVAITSDVTFTGYAVVNDNEDAIQIMIGVDDTLETSPSSALIGTPSSPTDASDANSLFSFDDITTTEWDNNPCVPIFKMRMRMDGSDDWTVQTLSSSDGMIVSASYTPSSKITKFSTSGTWTKDPRTKSALVVGWGGGGGGGSGRRGANGTNRAGGGGGACQGMFIFNCDASSLGDTETVTVGAGGSGGASQTSTSTNGNDGTAGGATSFGNIYTYSPSVNSFGSGGQAGSGTAAGQPYVFSNFNAVQVSGAGSGGTIGAASDAEDAPGSTGLGGCLGGGGAGGGGGINTGNTRFNGGDGGDITTWEASPSTILAGGIGGVVNMTQAGGNGNSNSTLSSGAVFATGTGGGGGAAPAAGGDGASPGGGGGGGGAGQDPSSNSGAGGDGADGAVWVFEYF